MHRSDECIYTHTLITIHIHSSLLGHKGSYWCRQVLSCILCCKERKLRYPRRMQCCGCSFFQCLRSCQELGAEFLRTPALRNQEKGWFLPLPGVLLLSHNDLWASWHTTAFPLPCQGDSIITPNKFTSRKAFNRYTVHSNVPDLNVS